MICKAPYKQVSSGLEFNCGRCMPCRINHRRTWTCRAVLESLCYPSSQFVTLTYDERTYPKNGSLSKSEVQRFLKRLRLQSGPVRYMAVGEYGSITQRAHYHAVFFGTNLSQDEVLSAWSNGYTDMGSLTVQSAQYLCGYTLKKMTARGDLRLKGRAPEFMLSSKAPGIGAPMIPTLAQIHETDYGSAFLVKNHDVIKQVRFGGNVFYIGRYLVGKLRDYVGLPRSDPRRIEAMVSDVEALQYLPDYAEVMEAKRLHSERKAQAFVSQLNNIRRL